MKYATYGSFITKLIVVLFLMTVTRPLLSHHYKGLPHYSYFDNYPQVPILEFFQEDENYEVFITVYNFQGLSLEMVDAPNDVRLYIYVYDVKADTVLQQKLNITITSHDQIAYTDKNVASEQENIFVIRATMPEQDDLRVSLQFSDSTGKAVTLTIPIQITKTILQKYGLAIAIALFLIIVMTSKLILDHRQEKDLLKETQYA